MTESLKLRSSIRCDIGRSNRAATNRESVLSSEILSCPLPVIISPTPFGLLRSFTLARSKHLYKKKD